MKIVWAFFFSFCIAAGADELKLVELTDVHGGGPYYSEEAFTQAYTAATALQPDVMLLNGDFGDNSFDRQFFYDRLEDALREWRPRLARFPGAISITLGNDDFAHNYQTHTDELNKTYEVFRRVFGNRYYLDRLGNGRLAAQPGGVTFLSLNSQIFSRNNATPEAPEQAVRSFAWLRTELKSLQTQGAPAVALLTHIPPSWDLYNQKPGWKPEYIRELCNVLEPYPNQVVILCGHFHRNHVQGLLPQRPIPVLTAGALATKYGYQPNWREYRWTLEPGPRLEEIAYTIHYPGHSEWDATFQLIPRQLARFFQRLHEEPDFYRSYVSHIYGQHEDWREWADSEKVRRDLLSELWVSPEISADALR